MMPASRTAFPAALVCMRPAWRYPAAPDAVAAVARPRFGRRRPFLSAVGRLDKDTSGLLLLTDDGTMLHRINSPKKGIWKVRSAAVVRLLRLLKNSDGTALFIAGCTRKVAKCLAINRHIAAMDVAGPCGSVGPAIG